jgi:broad specificity phosphatase PhoE
MRLYLIRHGQSVNNALYSSGTAFENSRSHDPELTAIGHQQAEHAAQFLTKAIDMPQPDLEALQFTHLYVSPMIRALDTAKPIAAALGIQPEVWIDIHEIGGLFTADDNDVVTAYPGMSRQQMADCYPNYTLPDGIRDDGWWHVKHGRETPTEFLGRAIAVAMNLRERTHTQERIALVAHAAFFDSLLKALLNQLPNHPSNLFYNHYNTGITRIDFNESHWAQIDNHMRFHYLNRVDHLPPELRTW